MPAVLRVLLEPGRAGRLRRRADHRRVAAGVRRGAGAGRAAAAPVRRGAAAAPGRRRARRHRPRAGHVQQPGHQRGRPDPAPGGGAARRRAGPRPGQRPGRRAGAVRRDRGHAVVRPQDRGVPAGEGAGLAADAQRRPAPPQHRPRRRGPPPGRGARRRPDRAGQHPVLRVGLAQPRRAAAQPGPAGRGRAGGRRRPRPPGGPDGGRLRIARLLQPLPQALHGRVGEPPAHRHAQRRRPALPGGADAAAAAGERAGGPARADLGVLAALRELPGHGVDAAAVPQLRPSRRRLRRLPVPGAPADRRREPHRVGSA